MQPELIFDLYRYEEYNQHTRLINLHQLGHVAYIKIPDDMASTCNLFKTEDITDKPFEIDYIPFIQREEMRPWFRVDIYFFNKTEGFHLYKFTFIDIITDELLTLYLTYTIQNDNPDKPYVYMRSRNQTEVEAQFLNMDDGERYERRQ